MEFPSSQPSVDQFQVASNEEQLAKVFFINLFFKLLKFKGN